MEALKAEMMDVLRWITDPLMERKSTTGDAAMKNIAAAAQASGDSDVAAVSKGKQRELDLIWCANARSNLHLQQNTDREISVLLQLLGSYQAKAYV